MRAIHLICVFGSTDWLCLPPDKTVQYSTVLYSTALTVLQLRRRKEKTAATGNPLRARPVASCPGAGPQRQQHQHQQASSMSQGWPLAGEMAAKKRQICNR